ncbi:hypothetical protein V1477_011517 [Vespula maculifrons]|uniref:Homing endonuclease LAGLIDADG domain-containing protein n=1 Tax=Vespula maculifrons TaxID=7453 RepID=A0ABD2BZF0_VESMC
MKELTSEAGFINKFKVSDAWSSCVITDRCFKYSGQTKASKYPGTSAGQYVLMLLRFQHSSLVNVRKYLSSHKFEIGLNPNNKKPSNINTRLNFFSDLSDFFGLDSIKFKISEYILFISKLDKISHSLAKVLFPLHVTPEIPTINQDI